MTVPARTEGAEEGSPVLVAHGAIEHEVASCVDGREQVKNISQTQLDVIGSGGGF